MTRRTKIVATVGPASLPILDQLVAAGMDVARINLSHGTPGEHLAAAAAVRAAAGRAGRPVGILVDLPGPKLRLGVLAGPQEPLAPGDSVALIGPAGEPPGTVPRALPIDDPAVLPALRIGDRILLADGELELRVSGEGSEAVLATVVRGGRPRSRAGVNVPAERLPDAGLDPSDVALLPEVEAIGPDLVGQSFVRAPSDVLALRARLPADIGIIAKIETRPAAEAIEAILEVADGIMVARGDLGVELPFEEVPLIQKRIVRAAVEAGRPCIVATQMLESMTAAPRPTRAEASDVANAVLDGTDAVMLSAETAVGAWPVLAVEAAARISAAADRPRARPDGTSETADRIQIGRDARSLAIAAAALASSDPDVAAIACSTLTGRTAEVLSVLRPWLPIIALTPSAAVARRLTLRHGVLPVVADAGVDVTDVAEAARAAMHAFTGGLAARAGHALVVLASRTAAEAADVVAIVRPDPGDLP